MMPWDWIGNVTIRSETLRARSTSGMMRMIPGPRGPSRTFPRRNWTTRSYCLTIFIDIAATIRATTTSPMTTKATM
jgi:hypothetical protein